jgi:hypothetical protein
VIVKLSVTFNETTLAESDINIKLNGNEIADLKFALLYGWAICYSYKKLKTFKP